MEHVRPQLGVRFQWYMKTCISSRVTEMIQLDNGRGGDCWFTGYNETYDLSCAEEHGGGV